MLPLDVSESRFSEIAGRLDFSVYVSNIHEAQLGIFPHRVATTD